jgi:biopolymer transport protein ExbD
MALHIKKGTTSLQLPVVPLVDTLINLLIFFLVATRVAEAERELEVMLPDASEAQPITSKPREMIINIDSQGHYFVTDRSVDVPELDQILQQASASNPGRTSVVIRSDKRCRFEFVVRVMNSCKKAKIRDYRVTTRETTDESGP